MPSSRRYDHAMNQAPSSTVLITGASSGIGAALAREFARAGWCVALVARRLEKLEVLASEIRAAGGKASVHRGDVTVDGALSAVVGELGGQGIFPAVVVANAGFGVVGRAQDITLQDYQRQFDTNVYGVIRTLHETLPALRKTQGRFVIVGSVAGHISGSCSSAYSMSKFAVRALAEALHGDLRAVGASCT
jgi:short-subunit dehydrogenase